MKKRRIIILIVIILLIGAGSYYYFRLHKKTAAVTYQTGEVTKGTLVSTVTGSGNITVSASADVSPNISGTVADLKANVGDQVKAGQTLFAITNADLDVSVSKAYTALLQAKQKLTQAQSDLTTANQNYSDLKENAAAQAQLAYDQAQQNLAQAKYQLELDQDTLDKYADENEKTAGTHTAVEINLIKQKIVVDKTTITSKESDVVSAKTDLAEAKAGTSPEITTAKSQVESTQISVQATENDVKSAELDYENQKETANERTVSAPIDGTVTAVNVANGDELGNSGSSSASSSSSGSAAIVIQDLNSLKAIVSINEVDIASIKVDQKASMTFDAVSDLTLTGKVEKVDTVGTSEQGVVTYSATIGFDALDSKIKPEMSVNATITTDVKQDALIVSSSAVKTQGEAYYVEILENGAPVQRTVEIGVSNDTQTEIISGLSEGDSVVTQTITADQTSTASSTNSSNNSRSEQGFGEGLVGGPGGMF
ncbi:MAG: efflux RND transporter periplasmic adaptor subunit [Patescibacteria group bacterium]|nr:efflux RND transporter periplasmic adaptor subunit [Patescibacteria group bacterium]